MDLQANNSTLANISSTPVRNEALALAEIGVQSTIFILAVFGNSIVLLVFLLRRRRLTRMHLLMLHLSAADLFVAFFSVLPQLIWDITNVFYGNDFLCRSVKYFQIVAIYASSYVLVMTAIDRYIAICHPFISHKWSSRKVHLMVIVAWMLSLFFSLPQMFIFSYMERAPGVFDCWGIFNPEWTLELYVFCNTFSVYIAPTIILTFCYGRICYTVWKRGRVGEQVMTMSSREWPQSQARYMNQQRSLLNGGSSKYQEGKVPRAKAKTVRLTLTVVLCYMVCWSPFYIAQMWAAFDPNAPFGSATYAIILLLASLNSCTNPWIYLIFSDITRLKTSLQQCCLGEDANNRGKSSTTSVTFATPSLQKSSKR